MSSTSTNGVTVPAPSSASRARADASAPTTTPGPPNVCLLERRESAAGLFLPEFPGASLYHSLAWRDALIASGGGTPCYLVALVGTELFGVFPLMEMAGGEARGRLLSLPSTPAAGPLAEDESICWLLCSRALALAEARGLAGVWMRSFERPHRSTLTRHETEFDWVRLPLERVANYLAERGRAKMPAGALRPAEAGMLRGLRRDNSGARPELLRHLLRSYTHGVFAIHERDRLLGVIATAGAHVHVLSTARRTGSGDEGLLVLAHAAQLGQRYGARWVDFPCTGVRGASWAGLLEQPDIAYARETRVHASALPRCAAPSA